MQAFPIHSLPNFQAINPENIEAETREHLSQNLKNLDALLTRGNGFTWENLLQPLEEMHDALTKYWAPISHLHGVCETENLRKAYNAVQPLLSEYHTAISHNERLFQAIQSIADTPQFNELTTAQQKIIEHDLRDFKLAGVQLSSEKKGRLGELNKELGQLMTKFSENLLDATEHFVIHVTDEVRLKGLPEQAKQLAANAAEKRGVPGYIITLEYPSYASCLKFLEDREIRKELYAAYSTRASDQGPDALKWDNTPIIEAILAVRHEMVQLIGFDNYATYSLATKTAQSPDAVLTFLYDLLKRAKPYAVKEYREIVETAKRLDQLEQLEIWDISYYSEKLRSAKFDFSQEDLRPFFPIDKVLQGLFNIVEQLFGVRVRAEHNVSVWHEDVQFFSLYESSGEMRGGFYIDLYARSQKRDGAWMDECLPRFRLKNGTLQYPVAFLTCNFMPAVPGKPALLTHDEVITLFHEFGHCLHHMLTKVDYPSIAGINGVPWDIVEFPSQLMEFFCWEKASLDQIAVHYETGEPLPDALYRKMIAAKYFETGLHMVRQLEFALFDFRLHLNYDPAKKGQVQKILDEVRYEAAVLSVPEYNRAQHSFSHIFAGGYAAGYYSYKWAEVWSADAYEQFASHGVLDQKTGQQLMEHFLERGGAFEPMDGFVAFRGRKPEVDALLKYNGLEQNKT